MIGYGGERKEKQKKRRRKEEEEKKRKEKKRTVNFLADRPVSPSWVKKKKRTSGLFVYILFVQIAFRPRPDVVIICIISFFFFPAIMCFEIIVQSQSYAKQLHISFIDSNDGRPYSGLTYLIC